MNKKELIEFWRHEEQVPFKGWDFSYIRERMIEESPPWSYKALAMTLMAQADSLLDMGTGGGERLLSMREAWPPQVFATEGYAPNVALARKKLEPWGVEVFDIPGEVWAELPFPDESISLIINRHSGYGFFEVARMLGGNGRFLTQQIGSDWAFDLKQAMGLNPPQKVPSLMRTLPYLLKTELCLEKAEEWHGAFTFTDVGAIVYYLKAIPWLVSGFSVNTHLSHLLALQEKVENGEALRFRAQLYLLQARKPKDRIYA